MPNVVIADDEEFVRYYLSTLLENIFFKVVAEVESGEGLLDVIEEMKPDILFLDINMPNMKGDDFLKEYQEQLKDLCVIVLTINSSNEVKYKLEELGYKYFLKKNTPTKQLVKYILDSWKDFRKAKK